MLSFGDVARLMHPDDGSASTRSLAPIAKGDAGKVDQIFRMRHAGGHYVWMRARAQVIRAHSGRVHMIGIAMDVTEQHRLAQRYAEADQRLADAIECTSEAFVLWDKYDRLVMCNAHFQQAYGLPDSVLVPGTERTSLMPRQRARSSNGGMADADGSGYSSRRPRSAACRRALAADQRAPHPRRRSASRSAPTSRPLKRHQERLRELRSAG